MELPPNVWRARIAGTEYSAQDAETLREWAQQGRLGRGDYVWDPRVSTWRLSRDITELEKIFYPAGFLVPKWKYDLFPILWPFFFGLLGVIGLLLVSASVGAHLGDTLRTLQWPSTEGHIVLSTVTTVPDAHPTAVVLTYYRADIVYEYHVSGRTYQSTRLQIDNSLPDLLPDRQQAEQRTAPHRLGDSVVVYYDPETLKTRRLIATKKALLHSALD